MPAHGNGMLLTAYISNFGSPSLGISSFSSHGKFHRCLIIIKLSQQCKSCLLDCLLVQSIIFQSLRQKYNFISILLPWSGFFVFISFQLFVVLFFALPTLDISNIITRHIFRRPGNWVRQMVDGAKFYSKFKMVIVFEI